LGNRSPGEHGSASRLSSWAAKAGKNQLPFTLSRYAKTSFATARLLCATLDRI